MAREVGRVAVPDPGARLPGGFWEAVAVWLERPQVVNKRLCGARVEARRSAVLPRAEACGLRPSAGPEPEERGAAGSRAEEERGSPDRGAGPRPEEPAAVGRDPEGPGGRRARGPLAGDSGRPRGPAGWDDAAAALGSLWDDFSAGLAGCRADLLAFLSRSAAGSRPEAPLDVELVLRTLVPKAGPRRPPPAPRREVVVQDVLHGAVTFLPLEEEDEGSPRVQTGNVYRVELSQSEEAWFISVLIFCPERWHADGVVQPSPSWLGEELPARLARWSAQSRKSDFSATLSLVPVEQYSRTYQALKEKYRGLVKVWPEVTDPEKFVYEDVAIATYLLILWEEERAERGVVAKQSFVDLGCGNGLLAHILSNEGHPGRGIDVRRRKIWEQYGPQTRLEEAAITPSDATLFPGTDWLLGNHSDELTPWIPVIAARLCRAESQRTPSPRVRMNGQVRRGRRRHPRGPVALAGQRLPAARRPCRSSYDCRFFVLPCCFFDFAGKYRRRQSRKTQYREYLDFVREVGVACGFHVQEDCLRIPSTKRVCLVGRSRTYPAAAEAELDEQRARYIRSRQGPPSPAARGTAHPDGRGAGEAGGPWLPGFQPREKAEPVRNCAGLPRAFLDRVVLQVAGLLLRGRPLSPGGARSGAVQAWDGGESRALAEVARALDTETLQRLKRECGGLQTLLRNSHQVFEVVNGRVHFRDWREERPQERRPDACKTRICWFFAHHPDGCVLPAHRCPFAHGPGELRPPLTPKKKQQLP